MTTGVASHLYWRTKMDRPSQKYTSPGTLLWAEYADWLEAERDKLRETIVEQEAEIFRLATIVQELAE
jgi:hypothetical protein